MKLTAATVDSDHLVLIKEKYKNDEYLPAGNS